MNKLNPPSAAGIMGHSLDPELSLIAACAIWPPSEERLNTIRSAAAGTIDWAHVLRMAERHEVIGLVCDGVRRADIEVPSEIASTIRGHAVSLAHDNLVMAAEAVRLQRLFDEAEIRALFLKGTTLAVLAYGNLAIRSAKDIDILVPEIMLCDAIQVLEHAGYYRFDPPMNIEGSSMELLVALRKDFGFCHESKGICVELHWRLFQNHYAMTDTSLIESSSTVDLTRSNSLRTLNNEDLFAYLCMHGARHWWYQLKWLADVGALLAGAPENAEILYLCAKKRGANRAAAQAILLCHKLFGTPLSAALKKELKKTPMIAWLQETALQAMTSGGVERIPRKMRLGTTRGSLSALLLVGGWRYRIAELRNLFISETDIVTLPMPKPLWFLYPILRFPLWIRRHAIRRN